MENEKLVDEIIAKEIISKFVDDLNFTYPVMKYNNVHEFFALFQTSKDLKNYIFDEIVECCNLEENSEYDEEIDKLVNGFYDDVDSDFFDINSCEDYEEDCVCCDEKHYYTIKEFPIFLKELFYEDSEYKECVEFVHYYNTKEF